MKSIVQEASSISKAIELAWIAAGKPREFTVKVFQEAQKNFFGFTKQYAKVALFVQESHKVSDTTARRYGHTSDDKRTTAKSNYQKKHVIVDEQAHTYKKSKPAPQQTHSVDEGEAGKEVVQKEHAVLWSDDMINTANNWVRNALDSMGKKEISFTTQANRYYLRITFNSMFVEDAEKERSVFRNMSFLLLYAMKKYAKRPLHGYKVVFVRQ